MHKTRTINSIFVVIIVAFLLFAGNSFAASSVYIPGVPLANSSAMGISCQYNYPAAGTVYCINQSPGQQVSSTGVITAGFKNRLLFMTPGSYAWTIPAGVTSIKMVIIGAGGGGAMGGAGGGYSESVIATVGGTAVAVIVAAGNSQAASALAVGSTAINATAGMNNTLSGSYTGAASGCGSGGNVSNTCGGSFPSGACCSGGGVPAVLMPTAATVSIAASMNPTEAASEAEDFAEAMLRTVA